MADFTIHVLGCGSAKPGVRHNPSCTVVDYRNNLYMIDCGEGAQKEMQRQHLKMNRLSHIFLTHLHGDHVLGLPGLVATLALTRKQGGLTIHTTARGAEMLASIFSFFNGDTDFQVTFNILDPAKEEIAFENNTLRVRTVPLRHRVPTMGYVFEEKPKPRHIRRDMIDFYNIPVARINGIKGGDDYITPDGKVVPNSVLTSDADPALSYAHMSDTLYLPSLADKVRDVTLLYHESTYLNANAAEARERFHSTAAQAATVARDAGAHALLLGHYSSRYRNDDLFRQEALEVFPRVFLADEGLSIDMTKLQ